VLPSNVFFWQLYELKGDTVNLARVYVCG